MNRIRPARSIGCPPKPTASSSYGRIGCILRLRRSVNGPIAMPRRRLLTAFLLAAVEAAAVLTLLCAAQSPAAAQVFNDRSPFQNRRAQPQPRGPFDWFFYPQPQHEEPRTAPAPPPVDYSKAPAAKKPE